MAFSSNVPHTVRGSPTLIKDGPDKGRADVARRLPGGAERHQAVAPTATSHATTTTTRSWPSS